MDDLYGGTSSYFINIATKSNGISFTFSDFSDMNLIEKSIKPNTKLIWLESLTNPMLKTVDIKAVSEIAKKYNCILAMDSTFTSPYLFNPLDAGADIVIHSATKYIGGHSDIIMGVIACNDEKLINKIRMIQSGIGAVPSPFDCYLALRGLKTLHLRMDASQKNALQLATFLESHHNVAKVIYPGLESHPQFTLVKNQFRGSGSIISFYIKGGLPLINKFLKSLKIFKLAVSLGAVESLLCAPALMTHAGVPKETRESIGITDNLIRISVGIEDINDLINDISQAFDESV
jgi:cystathionine gamma-lyase